MEPERKVTVGIVNGKLAKFCRNKDGENEKIKINISYFDSCSEVEFYLRGRAILQLNSKG